MNKNSDFELDIKNATQAINNGGVILYPTDTIWGIGCDGTDAQAVERIFEIKQRPKNKSVIILLAEAKDVLQYATTPHPDIIDIISSFNKPTTVIFDNAVGLADNVIHENGSVAIRVTKDPFCKALIKRMKKPLVSTSANISGAPSAPSYVDVSTEILNGVDYVVLHRQDEIINAAASQIVKVEDDGSLTYIRK